ncbi:hypothetical protein GCM10020331_100680 [Ectobacillus funiculus]
MKHAMNVMDDARREVEEYLDPEKKGTVRITFPISLAAHTLPTVIYAFRMRYPEARFQLKQALYRDLITNVIKGDFNLALIGPLPLEEKSCNKKNHYLRKIFLALFATSPPACEKALPKTSGTSRRTIRFIT